MLAITTLAALFCLGGCGGSGSKSSSTAAAAQSSSTSSTSTVTDASARQTATSAAKPFVLSSPAIVGKGLVPARYTCDGANVSLPLRWSTPPAGTRELALLVLDSGGGKIAADWAVAGLKANLTGLAAGKIPAGTVMGRTSSGHDSYSICPAKGKHVNYIAILYAASRKLALHRGFNVTQFAGLVGHDLSVLGSVDFSYRRR
jgi:phosphatidylethanolamine-binding protein (PEBP) family uncharacterized protein